MTPIRISYVVLGSVFGFDGKLPKALGAVMVDHLCAFDLHPKTRHARDLANALLLLESKRLDEWARRSAEGEALYKYPIVIRSLIKGALP